MLFNFNDLWYCYVEKSNRFDINSYVIFWNIFQALRKQNGFHFLLYAVNTMILVKGLKFN